MRVAICGATSTGKSTLIRALTAAGVLRQFGLDIVETNERAILLDMGCMNTGTMTSEQLRRFQSRFLVEKIANEHGQQAYITEHSYVDIAAYWTVRDCLGDTADVNGIVKECRNYSMTYSIHIILPFDAARFKADGYRATDMNLHHAVAHRIDYFLSLWKLRHAVVRTTGLWSRVREVSSILERIAS